MSAVRCGRLDRHEPHEWYSPAFRNDCPGRVITEGGQQCACGHPVAGCTCEQELADERAREWDS